MKLQSECQRRPTRISSGCELMNHKSAANNNSSRLKCSTIAKVPTAKSRLKQPVASLNQVVLNENQKKSNLTAPSITARTRPTSLAFKTNTITPITAATTIPKLTATTQIQSKLYSSILPKINSTREELNRKLPISLHKSNKSQLHQPTAVKRKYETKLKSKYYPLFLFLLTIKLDCNPCLIFYNVIAN